MLMAEKIPLVKDNPVWAKTSIGWVTCLSCGWNGHHCSMLSEKTSRNLYCPLCTSTRWFYSKRVKIHE